MQKALEMGKVSATGSFQLFIGVAASTMIMAISAIILGWLLTQEEYGLYSIALIPSYMAILFTDWGISAAITKYTASFRAENNEGQIYEIVTAGVLFETTTGVTLSAILFSLSSFIASTVFQKPESSPLIAISSVSILAGTILAASQSSFIGFEKMELNSLTTIFQAIVKSVASPVLVFLGFGTLGAVLGYTVSFLAAAALSLAILYFSIIRKLKAKNPARAHILKTLKEMFRYGFPLSISSIVSGFRVQFYAFMMAIYCTEAMVGNYHIAVQFATILTFLTTPISTVLFPAFSKINPKNENALLQTVFASSIKYTAIILIPATTAMMVLSKPMIGTLFGEKWAYAPYFLTLYVVSNLFVIFGHLILGSLLQGLGETRMQMNLSLITLAFGVPLAFLLIPSMGIVGLILTSITSGIPSMFLGLYWIWKKHGVKPDFNASIKILGASAIAALTTYLTLNVMAFAHWMELACGLATFLATYLITAPLIGAISASDIKNLKAMFSNLKIISKLFSIPLTAMEKLAKTHEQP